MAEHRQEYVKSLRVNIDKTALERSVNQFKASLGEIDNLSESFQKNLVTQFDRQKKKKLEIAAITEKLEELEGVRGKEAKKLTAELKAQLNYLTLGDRFLEKSKEVFGEFKDSFSRALGLEDISLKGAAEKLGEFLGESIAQAYKNITGAALYSTGSLITSSAQHEEKLTYGFSSRQAYGFDLAKEMLGIQSEEDLFYMNPKQREKFNEYVTKYSEMYDSMEQSGIFDTVQELELTMKEFKKDFSLYISKFISDNKDLIVDFMELGMEAMKGILPILAGILDVVTHIFNVPAHSDLTTGVTNKTMNQYNNLNVVNQAVAQYTSNTLGYTAKVALGG